MIVRNKNSFYDFSEIIYKFMIIQITLKMSKMKKIKSLVLLPFVFIIFVNVALGQKKTNIKETYSFCQEENGLCNQKCTVELVSGDKIALGSYVKVYIGNELLEEGYILKHVSGSIFILKNKEDANDPEICGGCCGGAIEINIAKKQIWGC
jgi:hypothetical protein